jgi:hypothetical protein
MKRNILLLIGIIGLVALEYGCTEEPITCSGSSEMQLTKINRLDYLVQDSAGAVSELWGERVAYDILIYSVIFDWERLASLSSLNFSVYAVTAPFTRWKPDSLVVLENGIDVTEQFAVNSYESIEEYLSADIYQYGSELRFRLRTAPALEAARSYIFKFFVGEEEFEVSSKSIVITP